MDKLAKFRKDGTVQRWQLILTKNGEVRFFRRGRETIFEVYVDGSMIADGKIKDRSWLKWIREEAELKSALTEKAD
jgi:hypothetical protein